VFADPVDPPNFARFTFLDPVALDFYPDWDEAADGMVALLRTEAGRNPTIAISTISSTNSRHEATNSGCAGRRTTSACT
jgi:hypothetical protein